MNWLLGGSTAIGAAGVTILAVFLYKMYRNNRKDLHETIDTLGSLNERNLRVVTLEQAVEDRDNTIKALEDERDRERKAATIAKRALSDAMERLSKTGSPASVASDINRSLDRLSRLAGVLPEVPDPEKTPTPEDS